VYSQDDINDTIAAISTPPGKNGIGIIRISGPMSLSIADNIFRAKNLKKASDCAHYTLHYGHIHFNNRNIDEVLVSVMRKPFTYTREDIIEINCHSGMACLQQILDIVLGAGARLAEPGEFTKRAFLNGRIDLVQAEAVCDIIGSLTRESLNIAQRQLEGALSYKIKSARKKLIGSAAELESGINFPDEGLEGLDMSFVRESLKGALVHLLDIVQSSDKGIIFREGATAVICGKTNVGKSSLMNSLLRNDRVIVSPAAGTTRDTIEETINIKGIPLKIADTAGIIQAADDITKQSVERSIQYIDKADLILLLLDQSQGLEEDDLSVIDCVKDKRLLVVLNKSDLPVKISIDEVKKYFCDDVVLRVSAKLGSGLDELEGAIYNILLNNEIDPGDIYLSNSRHIQAIKRALGFLESAMQGIDENRPDELILIDIKDAADILGAITGEIFTEDMLDTIFSKFCVGK
jgi:tRNA modification GTPase